MKTEHIEFLPALRAARQLSSFTGTPAFCYFLWSDGVWIASSTQDVPDAICVIA